MLTPEDLQGIANDITSIYAGVETECIKSIVDHITAGKRVTQASVWQMKKLNDVGMLRRDLVRKIAQQTKMAMPQVDKLIEASLSRSVGLDVRGIKGSLHAGKQTFASHAEYLAYIKNTEAFQKMLKATTAGCYEIMNLTGTKALQASLKAYTDAVNIAYLEMATGNYSYEDAVARAVGRIGKSGIRIVDSKDKAKGSQIVEKNGTKFTTYESNGTVRVYPLDSAIRRDLTTTINRSCGKLTLESATDMGTELVETSWHVGARPEHELWQGRIFSLNPKDTRYPYFYAPQEAGGTGYGDMLGLCGINCYHSFNPYFEGSERSTQENKPSAEENAKAYKEQQTQRAYERSLRSLKREQVAYQQAGMTDKARDAQRRINDMSSRYKQFLNETGRTRISMLEKVSGYHRISTKSDAVIPPATSSAPKAPVTPRKPKAHTAPITYDRNPNCELGRMLGVRKAYRYESYADMLDDTKNNNIIRAYKKVEDIGYKKTTSPNRAYYTPYQKTIVLNPEVTCAGNSYQTAYETLFHEMGHAIDHAYGDPATRKNFCIAWKEGLFKDTLKKDIDTLIASLGDDGVKALKSGLSPRVYANFSDMIEGATRCRIRMGFGHDYNYWRNPDNLPIEAFAELLDAYISNKESYAFLSEKLPNVVAVFEEMLEDLV